MRGVTDLMVMPGLINLDFADIRTVMSEMGKAMMGTGEAEGDARALEAAEAAISNPLLDEVSMKGARGVLINITGGPDMTLFEVDEAANRIREEVDPDANIIFGSAFDETLEGKIRVSVVATGIECRGQAAEPAGGARWSTTQSRAPAQPSWPPAAARCQARPRRPCSPQPTTAQPHSAEAACRGGRRRRGPAPEAATEGRTRDRRAASGAEVGRRGQPAPAGRAPRPTRSRVPEARPEPGAGRGPVHRSRRPAPAAGSAGAGIRGRLAARRGASRARQPSLFERVTAPTRGRRAPRDGRVEQAARRLRDCRLPTQAPPAPAPAEARRATTIPAFPAASTTCSTSRSLPQDGRPTNL